jgi:hypothetical protein
MTQPAAPGEGWAPPEQAVPPTAPPVVRARENRSRPAPRPVPLRVRPMRLLDVLDTAFALMKARPRVVAAAVGPFVVPIGLLELAVRGDAVDSALIEFLGTPGRVVRAFDGRSGGLLVVLGELLVVALSGAVLARVVGEWASGRDPSPGRVLALAAPVVPTAAAAFVLVHLAQLVAAIALVVGALFAMPLFVAVAGVVGVERAGPVTAVRRSVALCRAAYGRSLSFALLCALISTGLEVLVGWIPSIVADALGPDSYGWVVLGVSRLAVSALVTAFVGLAAVVFYLDRRVRTEGLDLELAIADAYTVRNPSGRSRAS